MGKEYSVFQSKTSFGVFEALSHLVRGSIVFFMDVKTLINK